ncbi:thiamine diphosphokinase [Jannaschia sp. Os4]|uniref:thiamine diphosphokinase n=1 Tax=Jannaschia sp. Os4 TaxID=2807617 RepID=UPI00193931E7|nr:thiamine diphosphokinase [Jannaschia sp. Os4]MBM2574820.1 thiamine diphosphokinase [Jannaschia sp. Os4]
MLPDSEPASQHSARAADGSAVTLLGAGPSDPKVLSIALTRAPRLVAVDGGADVARARRLRPERVVGDLDSISAAARAAFADRMEHVAEQDTTDLQKALRTTGARVLLGVGFLGGRFDHALAALSALAGEARPVVLLSAEDCVCLAPPALSLEVPPGTRVSLWPLGPAAGTSEGLRWPLDGLTLRPEGPVGTSNAATGPVRLRLEGGPVALLLPLEALDALLAGLGHPLPLGPARG